MRALVRTLPGLAPPSDEDAGAAIISATKTQHGSQPKVDHRALRARDGLLAAQRRFARAREIELDEEGVHTRRLEDNLHRALGPDSREALASADDAPLGADLKPGALQRLDSAWSIATNVFEPACPRDAAALARALGWTAGTPTFSLAPVFVPGGGPAARAHVLADTGGPPLAIVASYGEAYECGPSPLDGSLLDCMPEVWRALPGTRRLALDLRHNPDRFEALDVAGLLGRILALNGCHGTRGYALQLLWFDAADARADRMRSEIDRFRIRVGGEVDFRACSWQRLIEAASRDTAQDPAGSESAHVRYLRERYVEGGDPVTPD